VGKEAEDLTRHDKWLCMMYPRLKLLHKLLADDGAIFISIDDNEQANLKLVMDEIFGRLNFLSNIIWNSRKSVSNDAIISLNHNHTLVYTKDFTIFKTVKANFKLIVEDTNFSNPDNDIRGSWTADPFDSPGIRPNLTYEIVNPNTGEKYLPPKGRCWRTGPEEYEAFLKDNRIIFGKTGKSKPQLKRFLSDAGEKGKTPTSIWDDVGTATNATQEIQAIFDEKAFNTPKPTTFIERVIQLATDKSSIVLDSFAGSGTTAHAVLNMNKLDNGKRKFIVIEMEEYAETITAERVKRVMNGYGTTEGTGGSFDFYELGQPLFNEAGNLNESVGIEKIRQYVYYTETKENLRFTSDDLRLKEIVNQKSKIKNQDIVNPKSQIINQESQIVNQESEIVNPKSQIVNQESEIVNETKHFLGKHNDTAYYFNYEKDEVTTLDHAFLASMKTKAEQYVIYADNCLLTKDFMTKHHIIFKKIPRDITRF
jgi:adenine-specific DNA-methyltransferase